LERAAHHSCPGKLDARDLSHDQGDRLLFSNDDSCGGHLQI
jgi:hypothetical protein